MGQGRILDADNELLYRASQVLGSQELNALEAAFDPENEAL